MEEYIKAGFARKLTENEATRIMEKTNNLPYHHIFNKNKPEKVKIMIKTI